MAKLADARRSLEKAKESAMERLRQLEAERDEIKSSVKSLDAALRALKGSTAKPKRKQKSTDEDFSKIVDETLQTNGPSTLAEIQTAIQQRFDGSEMSTHGLETRLQAELSNARFVLDGDRFRFQANG